MKENHSIESEWEKRNEKEKEERKWKGKIKKKSRNLSSWTGLNKLMALMMMS